MNKRPVPVVIISCVYILTGALAFAFHVTDFKAQHPFQYDVIWAGLVRLLAVVCGVYMLRAQNWARWLALAWMAFHVILSIFHSMAQLAIHSLFFAILAYFLFRPTATRYFRAAGTQAT
jgi:hypothetical protein